MTFSEALEQLKQAKKIRLNGWKKYIMIEEHVYHSHSVLAIMRYGKSKSGNVHCYGHWRPSTRSILSDNWEVVEEE